VSFNIHGFPTEEVFMEINSVKVLNHCMKYLEFTVFECEFMLG